MADIRLQIPTDGATLDAGVIEGRSYSSKAGRLELATVFSEDFSADSGWTKTNATITGGELVTSANGYAVNSNASLQAANDFTLVVKVIDPNAGQEGQEVGIKLVGDANKISFDVYRAATYSIRIHYNALVKASYVFPTAVNTLIGAFRIRRVGTVYYLATFTDTTLTVPVTGEISWDYAVSRTVESITLGDAYHTGQIKYDDLTVTSYLTTAPTATLAKIGAGAGIKFKPYGAGIWIPENVGISGSPSVPKYQYAKLAAYGDAPTYNGTWLAQADLRTAIGDRTDTIEALMIKAQFNSSGAYSCSIDDGFVPAEMVGGGGVSKGRLINTGGF